LHIFNPPPKKIFRRAPLKNTTSIQAILFDWLNELNVECPEGRYTHKHAAGVWNAVLTFKTPSRMSFGTEKFKLLSF